MDGDGLLRVKTRITQREDSDEFQCPVVLPSNYELVKRLVRERRQQSLHVGVQVILSDLCQHFWILMGRKMVRGVIAKCVQRKRWAAKGIETIPTPLPEERAWDTLVFEVNEVDFTGSLYLKEGEKMWIMLRTCAVYHAEHFQLITNLSTNGFMLGWEGL
jgi:hypothetical protein